MHDASTICHVCVKYDVAAAASLYHFLRSTLLQYLIREAEAGKHIGLQREGHIHTHSLSRVQMLKLIASLRQEYINKTLPQSKFRPITTIQ